MRPTKKEHFGQIIRILNEEYERGYDDGKNHAGQEAAEALSQFCEQTKADAKVSENDAYQRGLNDAWEAARKITLNTNQGGVPTKELAMIFGEFNSCSEIMVRSTASEAVAKLKEYKQKQADDTPFKRIKAQIESMMYVQGVNIADICMAVEELREGQNESERR